MFIRVRVLSFGAVALGLCAAKASFAQTPAPSSSALPPLPPPGQPQPQPYPPPAYGQPGAPQQPGYPPPQGYPPAQPTPPSYGQPAPYGQPPPYGYGQPAYSQPGYGYPTEPPIPPPPKRTELQWSLRFNIFDLIFGRVTPEVEYAVAGPLSLTIGPQYIFGDPQRANSDFTINANGYGVYGELGLWVEGRPLRGYFLKGHVGYAKVTFHGDGEDVPVPETKLGVMFGSQSIYGGWFTLAGGFGVVYDTQSQEQTIRGHDAGVPNPMGSDFVRVRIPASGLFGKGWDLLSQISIGGSF